MAPDDAEVLPLFPLPDVVFFPRTILPLHIFEPRYRRMVRDARESDGRIAMALLCPGWERRYEGAPAFHALGTIGRMEDVEPLEDGRFHLRLVGLGRVRLSEIASEAPYRLVRVVPLPEAGVDESDAAVAQAKLDILASHSYLMREISGDPQPSLVLDESVPFESAVNQCCASLPVAPQVRQELLREDCLLRRGQRASAACHEVLEHVLRLKTRLVGGGRPTN